MNKEINGIIYHELGHLLGYIISNKNTKTKLGDVDNFILGNINYVVSKQNLYHQGHKNLDKFIKQISINTKKTERTIAWFIEVILGCTIQSLYEKKEFRNCFNNDGYGKIDFGNLVITRASSYFKWNINQIYEIQKEISALIIKYQIIEKLKPIANRLKNELINIELEILEIKERNLKELSFEVSNIISQKMVDDYMKIVSYYTGLFDK